MAIPRAFGHAKVPGNEQIAGVILTPHTWGSKTPQKGCPNESIWAPPTTQIGSQIPDFGGFSGFFRFFGGFGGSRRPYLLPLTSKPFKYYIINIMFYTVLFKMDRFFQKLISTKIMILKF